MPSKALAEQPDGKILIGGSFLSLGGTGRSNLARVDADGNFDTNFNPAANEEVHCVAVQQDGKIIVGGRFTNIAGTFRVAVARLEAGGTIDTSLLAQTDDTVRSIAIQPDGKIIIAGDFSEVGGLERHGIARILASGSVDSTFDADLDSSSDLDTMALDKDGNILIGGDFFFIAGLSRRSFARLDANGSLDTSFTHPFTNDVCVVSALPDGKILAYGPTSTSESFLRLNNNGSIDGSFNAPDNFSTENINPSANGLIFVADRIHVGDGDFTLLDSGMARLQANGALSSFAGPIGELVCATILRSDGTALAAYGEALVGPNTLGLVFTGSDTDSLTLTNSQDVTWTRNGDLPELESASFQVSIDGTTWTPLGPATPSSGTWVLNGTSPPVSGMLRARGVVRSGSGNGSNGLIETIISYPGNGTQSFSAWAATEITTIDAGADAAFDGNPDGDGFGNSLEWIMGGDPLSFDSAADLLSPSGGTATGLTLSFTREDASETEADLDVEFSNDLFDADSHTSTVPAASSTVDGVTYTIIENGSAPDDVTANIPAINAAGGKLFGRVRATEN